MIEKSLWFEASSARFVCPAGWTTDRAMTLPGGIAGLIDQLLPVYDISGSRGCRLFPERTSLLIEVTQTTCKDDRPILFANQLMPDGFGPSCFWSDDIEVPQECLLNPNIQVLWDSVQPMPCSHQKIWLRNVMDLGSWPEDFIFDESSFWMQARPPAFDSDCQTIHHVEFFSGGFGGWTMANHLMRSLVPANIQSVAIEKDPQVAKAFAASHRALFHKPVDFMPRSLLSHHDGNWVLCTDICQDSWMPAVAQWGVHFLTISSPCGPWSGASHAPGLHDPSGQLIIKAVFQARYLRPMFIGFENVPGFARHCHKSILMRVLRFCGYQMVWERTIDVQSKLGISRPRWIAIATRINQPVTLSSFQFWTPTVVTPCHDHCVLPWETNLQELSVTPTNYQLANDAAFFKRTGFHTQEKQIIQLRTFSTDQVLPPFMAQYGSQHELPIDHLRRFGLLSHFKEETQEWNFAVRHWHPAEIALLHGTLETIYIPKDFKFSWMLVGNAITTLHASLVLQQILNSMMNTQTTADEMLSSFHGMRLTKHNLTVTECEWGLFLTKPDMIPSPALTHSLDDLFQMESHDMVWIPGEGCKHVHDFVSPDPMDSQVDPAQQFHPHTQVPATIEVTSSPEEVAPTAPFMTIYEAVYQGDHFTQRFHVAEDIHHTDVERYWFSLVDFRQSNEADHTQPSVLYNSASGVPSVCVTGSTVAILIDAELTIMAADNKVPLAEHQFMTTLPMDLFDVFGPVNDCQKLNYASLLMKAKLHHGCLVHDVTHVFECFGRTQATFEWKQDTDELLVTIAGQSQDTSVIAIFWQNALHPDALLTLGRTCQINSHDHGHTVSFLPVRNAGICPPTIFQVAISVAAFRSLMDSPTLNNEHNGSCVQIKWLERILWEGMMPTQLNTAVLCQLLRFSLAPVFAHIPVRLIHKAKQIPFDLLVQDIATLKMDELNVFHIVLALKGGAGNKLQQRVLQQSSIAAILLEHGFDLKWITTTTETLLPKYNITKLQAITAQSSGSARTQALLSLIQEAAIQIPEPTKPASQKVPSGAPWQPKRHRKADVTLNPMDFRICPQFFTNQDGSEVVQLDTCQPQATGLAIMLLDQAIPYLKGDVLSSDELGIVVLGPIPPTIDMPHKQIRFPAFNMDRQMVLLSGHLFQVGAREIQVREGDPDQIKPEDCTLVALTMNKVDWNADDWMQLVSKPIPFLRSLFAKSGFDQAILSIWGKSLRHGRAPASPLQAESLQLHCTVMSNRLHKFMAKSGFNFIYTTPKSADGRLDLSYKIIWVKDDTASMSVLAMKAPNCLGLVKGKNSMGLRFHQDDHAKAWEILCPGQPVPSAQMGDLVYKAEGLPFGTTADMMTKWGSKIGWALTPIRALGPQSWLLRCEAHPPPGLNMFNANAVLLRHLPPKLIANEPVVLGPKASRSALASSAPASSMRLQEDPWANWKGPRPMDTTAKVPEGPTEGRLNAQDEKIASLQKTLEKMCNTQEEFAVSTTKRFEDIEIRETANMNKVTSTIDAMRGDIDASLKQVMLQSTQLMDSRLSELKQMLRPSSKRPPEAGAPMED